MVWYYENVYEMEDRFLGWFGLVWFGCGLVWVGVVLVGTGWYWYWYWYWLVRAGIGIGTVLRRIELSWNWRVR